MPTIQHPQLVDLARRDARYAYEAYEFLFEALSHTQHKLGRGMPAHVPAGASGEHHVSGQELVEGFLALVRQQFGRMGRTVLKLWGINATDDIGEIVFNLIEAGLLGKADADRRSDFHALCDLDHALVESYEISWDD
ncbi:MAG: Minf_1886 family protein [Gemmataceae bacterium]